MTDFELVLTADSRGLVAGDKALMDIGTTAERTERRVGKATDDMAKGMQQVGRQSIFASQQMRMTSMQLSQVAQQASATGNWLQAIAIQLPDLALGLGPIGILAGAAAGALLPLAANFVMTEEEADDLADTMKVLESATKAYEEALDNASLSAETLVDRFGDQAEGAQKVYEALLRIAELDYYQSLTKAQEGITSAMSRLEETVTHFQSVTTNFLPRDAIVAAQQDIQYLNREFGLTIIQAQNITNALNELASANGPREAAEAARAFSDAIDQAAADGARITPEMRAIQQQALQASVDSMRFANMLNQANGEASTLEGTMSGVADQAGRAAANIAAALNAKQAAAVVSQLGPLNTLNAFERTPFQDEMEIQNERAENTKSQYQLAAEKAARSGNRGARSAAARAERERQAVSDLISELEEELRLVNETDGAKRAAAAVRRAGAAATEEEREKISTLVLAIEEEETARENALDQMYLYRDVTKGLAQDVVSALDDGKITWDEWADIAESAISRIRDKLLDDLLDSIFQVNKAAGGGGGGFLSSIFGGLFGGGYAALPAVGPVPTPRPSFDGGGYTGSGARAGGLDGKGGFMALLHPQETVVDHTKGQSVGGGQSSIRISLSPELVGQILQQAQGQTVDIVQQNNRNQKELYTNGEQAYG